MKELFTDFNDWHDITVDLPGTYYLQVVSWIYKENRLAEGHFVALGRRLDLSGLRHPIYLLGARDDNLVAPTSCSRPPTAWERPKPTSRRQRSRAGTSACSSAGIR